MPTTAIWIRNWERNSDFHEMLNAADCVIHLVASEQERGPVAQSAKASIPPAAPLDLWRSVARRGTLA
jgi:hypothetical protein